jgi:hypothetical protein
MINSTKNNIKIIGIAVLFIILRASSIYGSNKKENNNMAKSPNYLAAQQGVHTIKTNNNIGEKKQENTHASDKNSHQEQGHNNATNIKPQNNYAVATVPNSNPRGEKENSRNNIQEEQKNNRKETARIINYLDIVFQKIEEKIETMKMENIEKINKNKQDMSIILYTVGGFGVLNIIFIMVNMWQIKNNNPEQAEEK